MKTQFPEEEHAAIEKYFKLIAEYSSNSKFQIMMKFFPLWIAKIICSTPLVGLFTKLWTGSKNKSTLEVAQSLTKNKDLQTIFCYCWGDYGTIPSMSHFRFGHVFTEQSLTIKFTFQIYQYFLWLENFTDQSYRYFLLLEKILLK